MPDKKVAEMTVGELQDFVERKVREALAREISPINPEQAKNLKERFPHLFITEKDNAPTSLPDWARKA